MDSDQSTYFGEDLIFVISQPRSGSTLLQRVLSGHPEIQTSAETWLMLHPVYGRRKTGIEAEYNARWQREAVDEFVAHYTDGPEVHDNAIRAYARTYYRNALAKGNRRIFLDKTPRYFLIIEDLYRLFPKARFIFLLRNPMAVLASELETYVKGNWKVLQRFACDLVAAPRMIADGIALLGDAACTVRYEEFVANPEQHTRRIMDYIGLDYLPSLIDYAETPAPIGNMNDPVGVHRHSRPQTTSLENWKRLANNPQDAHLAHACLDDIGSATLERLGYDMHDIRGQLGTPPAINAATIYPWSQAIRPEHQWSLAERWRSERYQAHKRHTGSSLLAELGALRRTMRQILTQLGEIVAGHPTEVAPELPLIRKRQQKDHAPGC
ncbi:MAG: sulfotransferase [Pseudomonadales bacterium]|nr:sulfotransferase [Pseudomonadales bacterium]